MFASRKKMVALLLLLGEFFIVLGPFPAVGPRCLLKPMQNSNPERNKLAQDGGHSSAVIREAPEQLW